MDTTRDLKMPSGSEVEAATLHPPVHPGRFEGMKARGLAKVHDVQSSLVTAKSSLRDGAKSRAAKMQDSMRANPMKWVGIAAGAGLGLGLIGRVAQWRSRRATPDLVIIESSC